jgi:hypothetical protein
MSSDETRKYIDPVEGITLDGTHFKGGGYGFVGELLPIGDRVITGSGAGLSRIWSYIRAGTSFVQLTAFRSHLLLTINKERNHKLLQAFRAFNLSSIRVLGGWNEVDRETGLLRAVEEDSFFIPLSDNSQLTGDELAELAMMVSRQYDQDAFLYGDGEFVHVFHLLDHDIQTIGSYETLDTHKMEQGWSRVRGNKARVRIDPESGQEVVRPAAGQKWSWSLPPDMPSQAVPVDSYMASKLAGTHRPNPKFAANDYIDVPGKVAGETLPRQVREGFRFKGYYRPSGVYQAMIMLRKGTYV